MKIKLNNKKALGISNKGITSGFFEFEYSEMNLINKLPDLFKIKLQDLEFNATINKESPSPIIIETETIKYNCKLGQGKEGIIGVAKSMIKLDIFIDDDLSGLIRNNDIEINVGKPN